MKSLSWAGIAVAGIVGTITSATSARAQDCSSYTQAIAGLIGAYNDAAFYSKSGKAEKLYQQIQQILFSDVGEKGSCFETAVQEYVRDAYGLYDPSRTGEGESKGLISGGITAPVSRQAPSFVSKILEEKKLVFLTDSKRAELGGIWLEKDPETKSYNLIGGYDCATTTIYLDVTLRPYDLTTTLTHEFDHLFRDKTFKHIPEKLMTAHTYAPATINWSLFNLADEAEAVAASAAVFMGARSVWEVDNVTGTLSIKHHHYRIDNDFTLFSPDGPVAKFRDEFRFESASAMAWDLFGSHDFQTSGGWNGYYADFRKAHALRNQFFSVIAQAYFPGQTILLPAGQDFDQFFHLDHNPIVGDDFEHPEFDFLVMDTDMNGQDPWNYDKVNAAIDASRSDVCQQYLDTLNRGDLNEYLGTKFSKTSSIRPCVNFRHSL